MLRVHNFTYIHKYTHIHTHSHIDPVHSAGLALLCVFVGAEVCTHLLLVCVICLRQATALKGARLQTLHWDETPATGLRPEPWRTNTHRWRGHSYHGQSSHSITAQAVWHSGVFVLFKTIFSFKLAYFLRCVWIFCPYVATISPNWLVLLVHGGGTFDSSITTVFIMLLVRREKSLLILVLKSSFEHLLSECHVWI